MDVGEDHVVSILCCGGGSSLHLGLVCCCWDSSNFVGGLLVVTLVGLWLLHSTLCWSPVVLCMVVGKCSNFVRVLFVHLMVVAILYLVGVAPTLYRYLFGCYPCIK